MTYEQFVDWAETVKALPVKLDYAAVAKAMEVEQFTVRRWMTGDLPKRRREAHITELVVEVEVQLLKLRDDLNLLLNLNNVTHGH